jgi:hypothetical protein
MQHITVAELAKELGVSQNAVMLLARKVEVTVTRGASKLALRQADRVRARARDEAAHAAKAALRPLPGLSKRAPVGAAPATEQVRVGPATPCSCCGLNIGRRQRDAEDELPLCEQCMPHYAIAGEGDARSLARLQDHDRRLRLVYAQLWSRVTDLDDRLHAALRSRNSWRRVLVEVAACHEETPTGCSCGAKSFPCMTRKKIEQVNRGIARQIEDYLTLDDDELAAELGDDRPWSAA